MTTSTPDPSDTTAVTEPPKAQSLEELLADLDEDRRKVILEQVAKPRNEAKNLRERLKAAEPELAEFALLKQASKSDAERAQEALEAATQRSAALSQRLVRTEVKAALAGVVDNPDDIVDDLNLAKYVDADGEVDAAAIEALRAKYARFGGPRAPRPDPSQASSGNGRTKADPAAEFASFLNNQRARA